MPYYSYTSDDGSITHAEAFKMGEAPDTINYQGIILHRDYAADTRGALGGQMSGCWPMVSMRAGVLPQQIPELRKAMEERGSPGEIVTSGEEAGGVRFDSQRDYERYQSDFGLFQKSHVTGGNLREH